ncbi:MAG: hypothetical protein K2X90_01630 [Candidatus Babeliaceae bacterium]|nr:hypothetical protein [Candidatus Babeliaceae bacterium]
MCFSASASFSASAVLAVIGLVSLTLIKDRYWIPVALVPVFFGIQQFAEGLVWLYQWPQAALVFLFFAFVVWPFYIPWSCYMLESDNEKRSLLFGLAVIGLGVSLCLLFGLWRSDMTFYIQNCHIVYDLMSGFLGCPTIWKILTACYCLVTIAPFFISSLRCMKITGMLIAGSCMLAYLFYTFYFISVWCFFAALVSNMILIIIDKNKGKK